MIVKGESRQFNFFCSWEEIDCLKKTLLDNEAVILGLPFRTPNPLILESFPKVGGEFWSKVLLCPKPFLEHVKTNYIREQNYYVIDELRSPTVEFSMPFPDATSLRRARFYIRLGYYERNDQWIEHPAEVYELYTQLVRDIKRVLTKEKRFGDLISQGALDFENSGGELRQL